MPRQRTVPRKGDRVRVVKNTAPGVGDITTNPNYGVGATGRVIGFRNNRFYGRCAIVEVDGGGPDECVDWLIADIEIIP